MKRIGIILFTALLLAACSQASSPDPAEIYKNYSAEKLYQLGSDALKARNYSAASKYFEALDSLYPFGQYAQNGQLKLIYAYYKNEDYSSAIVNANQFIRLYPRDPHVDYAYYIKGLAQLAEGKNYIQRRLPVDMSYRDLTGPQQAFFTFRDLAQQYPNSQYAADAKQHMIYLRNMFAQHEINIANYYMQRKAYVAAANRATYVIQTYQHSPQVAPALVILVRANRAMHLSQAADDALRTLQANYSHYAELSKL